VRKAIAVISLDPWLDTLHGKSVLSLLINLAISCNSRILLLIPSRLPTKRISLNTILVYRIKLNFNLPVISYITYLLIALRYLLSVKLDLIIIDLPSLPLYIIYRYLMKKQTLSYLIMILSRPVNIVGLRGFLQLLYFRFLLLIGARVAWRVTVISPYEALEFSRWGSTTLDHFFVLPSVLGKVFESSNLVNLSEEDIQRLRGDLNINIIPKNSVILLYHGVLDLARGVIELVDMFISHACNRDNIYLVLIGEGNASGTLLDLIQRSRCKNIIFLGRRPYYMMPHYVAISDIALVAFPFHKQWMYQVPTKLIEAMALGKVIIATRQPGIVWTLGSYPFVCWMDEFSYKEFLKALNCAIEMLKYRKYINSNFILSIINETVYDRFSAGKLGEKLCRLINSLWKQ